MKTETRQYKDVAGNPVTLDWLVKNEPEWAANQIRHRDKLELAMNETERLESLLMTEDLAQRQGVTLDKAQELLLKRWKEIERLNALLKAERNRSNELTDRWAQVRTECGALADESVWEVLERIRLQRTTKP